MLHWPTFLQALPSLLPVRYTCGQKLYEVALAFLAVGWRAQWSIICWNQNKVSWCIVANDHNFKRTDAPQWLTGVHLHQSCHLHKLLRLKAEQTNKMTTIFTQNDHFFKPDHLDWKKLICSAIFVSSWDQKRKKWPFN